MFRANHHRALVTIVVAASATGGVAIRSQPAATDAVKPSPLHVWKPNSASSTANYGMHPYAGKTVSPYRPTQVPDVAYCSLENGTYKTSSSSPFWINSYAQTYCTDSTGMHPPTTYVGMNVTLYKREVHSTASSYGSTWAYVAATAVCGADNPTCAGVATSSFANSYISWFPPHVAVPNYVQFGDWGCTPNGGSGNWCSAVWGHQY